MEVAYAIAVFIALSIELSHMATPNFEGGWERESNSVPSKKIKWVLVNPKKLP